LDGHWQLTAQTQWLHGNLVLASGPETSRLELHKLDLDGLDQLDLSVEEGGEPLQLPDLDITIADLRSGGRHLGQLAFELRSEGTEFRARNITGELAGLRIDQSEPGNLRWMQGKDSATAIDMRLAFDDFGDVLDEFGYQRVLETESGKLELSLNWPGAPQSYSLQTIQGSLLLDVGSGSFLEAPAGASGALKVVGILNLASIVQRLSLSHMFESGIPFDTVDGEVYLHGGTIEVSRLDVKGASSRFQFSGVSDPVARTMDGELVATLPVANNLPWVAALAGGLPIAAGVFVVSKVFEKQFDRLSSAVYSIEGSWDDPQVKFDRIWDDSSGREPPARVAEDPQQPDVVSGRLDSRAVADQP
jgi:uncharacterized protein YhdP